jgi:hypothetical protein
MPIPEVDAPFSTKLYLSVLELVVVKIIKSWMEELSSVTFIVWASVVEFNVKPLLGVPSCLCPEAGRIILK